MLPEAIAIVMAPTDSARCYPLCLSIISLSAIFSLYLSSSILLSLLYLPLSSSLFPISSPLSIIFLSSFISLFNMCSFSHTPPLSIYHALHLCHLPSLLSSIFCLRLYLPIHLSSVHPYLRPSINQSIHR